MIDGLQPYAAMRDSGVPWLGRIPDHWSTVTLKRQVRFIGGGTPSKAKLDYWRGNIPWVSPKDMKTPLINDTQDHISSAAVAASATQLVEPGAVLIVVRSGILQHSIPTAINAVAVAINQDLCAIVPRPALLPVFLRALIDGNQASLRMDWTKRGATVESIEHNLLANTVVPMPTVPEQSLIVRFLDHAALQIQRYIRAKRKLIALLNEEKQAIIRRAITRGLDPNARLKPSGVGWLGDIPDHWKVERVKRVARIRGGYAFASTLFGDTGVPVVRMNNLKRGRLNVDAPVRVPEEFSKSEFALHAGDVLLGLSGSIGSTGSLGNFAVVQEAQLPLQLNQRVTRFELSQRLLGQFVVLLIQTPEFIRQMLARTTGTAQFNVSTGDIESIRVAVPPVVEQRIIATRLREQTKPIEAYVAKIEHQITLVREYATALKSAIVTGQLDVRDAAKTLPDTYLNFGLDEVVVDAEDTDFTEAGDEETEAVGAVA